RQLPTDLGPGKPSTKRQEKDASKKRCAEAPSPPCVPESVHRSARSSESAETAAGELKPKESGADVRPTNLRTVVLRGQERKTSGLRCWESLSSPRFSCEPT